MEIEIPRPKNSYIKYSASHEQGKRKCARKYLYIFKKGKGLKRKGERGGESQRAGNTSLFSVFPREI